MSTWLKRLIVLLFWLVVWQLVSLAVANPILLSDPITVAETLVAGVQTPSFWSTILFSALRIFVGFSCAFALSLILGALAHRYPIFAMLFDPAVQFIKSVPIVCIIVLLLIWFGSSTVSAVAVFLVAFPSFYFALVEGLKASDLRMREMLKVFRVSRLRRIFALHWPTVLPYLIAASKVTVGMSWKSGIAAELIGLPLGSLGERIYQAKITLSSADLFAHTLLIVLISLICERIFLLLLKKSGDWSWQAALSSALSSARPRAFSATRNLPSLVLSGVTKHYASKVILKEYSLTLRQGQRLALSGPSGSGKTTVLSLLAGLVKPDAGQVDLRATTSMVFQESRLFEERSALDNLALVLGHETGQELEGETRHETGQELEGETRHETGQARIAAILGEILPLDSLDKPVSQLSGGMRRRVELARALAAASDVLLLDEPFTGLDDENRRRAQAFVNKHLAGRALVIAGHDPSDFDSLHTTETEYTLGETGR